MLPTKTVVLAFMSATDTGWREREGEWERGGGGEGRERGRGGREGGGGERGEGGRKRRDEAVILYAMNPIRHGYLGDGLGGEVGVALKWGHTHWKLDSGKLTYFS